MSADLLAAFDSSYHDPQDNTQTAASSGNKRFSFFDDLNTNPSKVTGEQAAPIVPFGAGTLGSSQITIVQSSNTTSGEGGEVDEWGDFEAFGKPSTPQKAS